MNMRFVSVEFFDARLNRQTVKSQIQRLGAQVHAHSDIVLLETDTMCARSVTQLVALHVIKVFKS